jgi:hypothetical protein
MVQGRSNAKEPRLPVPPKSQNIGVSLASDRTQRHKPVSQCTAVLDTSSTPTKRHTPRFGIQFCGGGYHSWTEDEIAQFEKRHARGSGGPLREMVSHGGFIAYYRVSTGKQGRSGLPAAAAAGPGFP